MKHIFFIDDDQSLLGIMQAYIEKEGYVFKGFSSAKKALEELHNSRPDLIVSDVNMPDMDGYDFMEFFRAHFPDCWDIPVIFLTANVEKEDIIKGRRAGVDDYLTKPIDFDILLSTMATRLAQVERLRKAEGVRNIFHAERRRTTKSGSLINALFTGLENDEFKVFYQPKISKNNVVTGAEALVRWMPDSVSIVPPSVFIEAAETSHLILPLTERILEIVLEDVTDWKAMGFEDIQVSINTSALHFRHTGFIDLVKAVPDDMSKNIGFEITERDLIGHLDKVHDEIEYAKGRGISVYIDDFGIGYSSLSYLKSLPVSGIKIDKSFVDDCESSPTARLLLENIIRLGHIFEIGVVAEGAEQKGQVDILFSQGCDEIQGYYFSKPIPKDKFTEFLVDFPKKK